MLLLKILQWRRIDMREQVVPSKKIAKTNLTVLKSFDDIGPRNSQSRDKPRFFPPEPSQARNFNPKPSPNGKPSKSATVLWPRDHSVSFIIINPTFKSEPSVRKLANRSHVDGRHDSGLGECKGTRMTLELTCGEVEEESWEMLVFLIWNLICDGKKWERENKYGWLVLQ